jgi:hypothetical protein
VPVLSGSVDWERATSFPLYFLVIPVVWLGALGAGPLKGELMTSLGPTFAPLLAGGAKAAAIWFMVLNMFHGTLQPLAGAARTLSRSRTTRCSRGRSACARAATCRGSPRS